MPFCPICKIEYREGFTTCSECGHALVEHLPPEAIEKKTSSSQPVFLVSGSSESDGMIIEGCLRAADIPYLKKDRETGGYLRVLSGFSVFGSDYYVPSELFNKAQETLGATSFYANTNALDCKESDDNQCQTKEEDDLDCDEITNETSIFRRIGAIFIFLFWWI